MKQTMLLAMSGLAIATLAFAQAGSIGIFADAGATDCNLLDQGPGLCTFNVVHVLTPGATAVEFAAPQPDCFNATYLADVKALALTIGNSQTGSSVGYGACVASPIWVCGIIYFCQGLTEPCCYYPVVPSPSVPENEILIVDCNHEIQYATGGEGIINSDGSCRCDVPVQETTWGAVKALYVE